MSHYKLRIESRDGVVVGTADTHTDDPKEASHQARETQQALRDDGREGVVVPYLER